MMSKIRTRTLMAMVVGCFLVGNALAHIKNEASQFPDIEFSAARFDIVVLVGAGIIPETPVFEPDKLLSKGELAVWAALTVNLGVGGETPDTVALADSALDNGLVDSLAGDATIEDINNAIFSGTLSVDTPERVPSKAEAATFIAQQLSADAGAALLSGKGLRVGITGAVSAVEAGDTHHGAATYVITISGVSMPMYSHGRVANGPVDLLQWKGRDVGRSFVRGEGDAAVWTYLETRQVDEVSVEKAPEVTVEPASEPAPPDRRMLYGLVAAVVIIGVVLFFRRRRQG